jgi:putative tricarboxylic transport membrane protein
MARRDLLSSIVWLGVGLIFCAGALRYKLMHLGAYGPGFYPFIMACVLIALSAALIIVSYRDRKEEAAEPDSAPKGIRKILFVLIAVFGYGAVLPYAGFLLTTFILIIFLLRYIDPVRWPAVILIAVLTTLACYALFIRWLGVQMPRGILHF